VLIWLGRRTNGLVFSGERELRLLLLLLCFVGEAGEALLVWRLNGDVLAERRLGLVCIVAISVDWQLAEQRRCRVVWMMESQISQRACKLALHGETSTAVSPSQASRAFQRPRLSSSNHISSMNNRYTR
jgi:hypothetical protein